MVDNLHSKSDHEVGVMKQTFFLSADCVHYSLFDQNPYFD